VHTVENESNFKNIQTTDGQYHFTK